MTTYRDFDLTFKPHPVTGDLGVRTDVNAIFQSIRNILFSMSEEVLYNPEMGGNVYGMLFGPADALTKVNLQTAIEESIRTYEPRCDLKSVVVTEFNGGTGYQATVIFYMLNNPDAVEITIPLRRIR